jgi:hypothetical protein
MVWGLTMKSNHMIMERPAAADDVNASVPRRVEDRTGKFFSWLTPRRLILFVLAWLTAFTLGSLAISNPFASEPSAGATPNYWHVMYLHGLLIGMVGLIALVALEMFESHCTNHIRMAIVAGVVAATVLTAVGGIWDTRVPGAEAAMWTQIAGFFALDEILICLIIGFAQGWRRRAPSSRTIPYALAWLAAGSMLIAAVMGHIAGWILEFGDHPAFLGRYAHFIGVPFATFRDNLIGSHSHEMAVATMALVLAAAVYKYGYREARGVARTISRIGMAVATLGVVSMTVAYVAMAASSWEVPTYFQSANGTNGVAGDDLLTGVLVMGGGLLAIWPVIVRMAARIRSGERPLLAIGAAWAWTGSVIGVVIAGFWIELHETFFGAGDLKASGAANDAVFTWLHQDVGLFVMPTMVAVLVLADRLVARRYAGLVGWSALGGVTMLLLGGGIWVFVDPALHGAGYVLSSVGMGLLGISILALIASGLLGDGRLRVLPRNHKPRELIGASHG